MDIRLVSPRILLFSLATIFGVTACVYDPYYGGSRERWPQSYHYPNYYDYYFYPTIDVYFRYSTGDYFYHDKNKWYRSKTLPPKYYLDPKDRVIIRDRSDKPYINSKEHTRDYKQYPDYRRDKNIDKNERKYNTRSHDEYLKREKKNDYKRDR